MHEMVLKQSIVDATLIRKGVPRPALVQVQSLLGNDHPILVRATQQSNESL